MLLSLQSQLFYLVNSFLIYPFDAATISGDTFHFLVLPFPFFKKKCLLFLLLLQFDYVGNLVFKLFCCCFILFLLSKNLMFFTSVIIYIYISSMYPLMWIWCWFLKWCLMYIILLKYDYILGFSRMTCST